MTLNQFRKALTLLGSNELIENAQVQIYLPHHNVNRTITGLVNIFEFLNSQFNGWGNIDLSNLPTEFTTSYNTFIDCVRDLENIVGDKTSFERNINNVTNNIRSRLNNNHTLLYDNDTTGFLIEISQKYPKNFRFAYDFLILKNVNIGNIREQGELVVLIKIYEFLVGDISAISTREEISKKSIASQKANLTRYFKETEDHLDDFFKSSKTKLDEHYNSLVQLKTEKDSELTHLKEVREEELQKQIDEKNSDFKLLEETYQKKIMLSAPAEYWKERAKSLKSQGWISIVAMGILVILSVVLLYNLLWKSPEEMLTALFGKDSNPAKAIRWSIVFITLISFLAFAIRAFYKVAFSSFHLARDAEERYTLTYFYLALVKDAKVTDKERELIMQSLFSRADTGLLKDESGPTMPGIGGISNFIPRS